MHTCKECYWYTSRGIIEMCERDKDLTTADHPACDGFDDSDEEVTEREWSLSEIIESLRMWDETFYSESQTKWLLNKAADYLERIYT